MKRLLTLLLVLGAALPVPAQEYGVVRLSVCNMRSTPDYDAEMVSQALLGTPVHILRTNEGNGWPEIQSPDTYTGWVHKAGRGTSANGPANGSPSGGSPWTRARKPS